MKEAIVDLLGLRKNIVIPDRPTRFVYIRVMVSKKVVPTSPLEHIGYRIPIAPTIKADFSHMEGDTPIFTINPEDFCKAVQGD